MKQLTEKATTELLELKQSLENYDDTLESNYCKLYNILSDFDGDDKLQDYILNDDDYIENLAKSELESGGMARLYYFMGDVNWNCAELIHIDGYGNCEEATNDDLIDIIDEVIDDYGADADLYDNEE